MTPCRSPGSESPERGVQGAGLVYAPAADGAAGPVTRRGTLRPIAPGHYELVAILGQEAYDQLLASADLLGHAVPSGDLAEVIARGGESTVENLRLLCRAHNQHVVEQAFGAATMQGRREAAQRRRAEERLRKQADRERTEARKREIARQHAELGEAFRTLGYRGEALRRALAYCAERAGASSEERLKHALGCMAPNARRERHGQPVATPGQPDSPPREFAIVSATSV